MIDIKNDDKSESDLPADILEKGDELLPTDWQSKMHPLFERYDVDACGTIESKEDLTQLTMNALVKFNIRMDMEALDEQMDSTEIDASNRWDEVKFICWFVDYIDAGKKAGTKAGKKKRTLKKATSGMPKKATSGMPKKAAPSGPSGQYQVGSGVVLRMRGAYIQLWIDAYVESGDERVAGQVQSHPRTMPSERDLDSSHPDGTVLDHLLGAVEFSTRSSSLLANSDEHSAFLFEAVLPAIKNFFQVLGARMGEHDFTRIEAVFRRALKSSRRLPSNGAPKNRWRSWH